MEKTRTIEVFSAGCPACAETIDLVNRVACPSCEVTILDMRDPAVAGRAATLGIRSVPAVAIDGQVYVPGGLSNQGVIHVEDGAERYDPVSDSWETIAKMSIIAIQILVQMDPVRQMAIATIVPVKQGGRETIVMKLITAILILVTMAEHVP